MVLIKRYPNRKLYNTHSRGYVCLESVADLIRQGHELQVIDHVSGEDLTAVILSQIVLEQRRNKPVPRRGRCWQDWCRRAASQASSMFRSCPGWTALAQRTRWKSKKL